MDVCRDIFRDINLQHPVDSWEVNASGRDISAQEDGLLLLNELEIDSRALVLILLSMELKQVLANFETLQSLVSESDLLSGREEN